jgi:hypothetical protein
MYVVLVRVLRTRTGTNESVRVLIPVLVRTRSTLVEYRFVLVSCVSFPHHPITSLSSQPSHCQHAIQAVVDIIPIRRFIRLL